MLSSKYIASFANSFHIGFNPSIVTLERSVSLTETIRQSRINLSEYMKLETQLGRDNSPFRPDQVEELHYRPMGIIPKPLDFFRTLCSERNADFFLYFCKQLE